MLKIKILPNFHRFAPQPSPTPPPSLEFQAFPTCRILFIRYYLVRIMYIIVNLYLNILYSYLALSIVHC